MISKGMWKNRLIPALGSCLGSEVIALQTHKFCVRRGISTETWVEWPKSASHWWAQERGCCFFASLCCLFNGAPWVRVFVEAISAWKDFLKFFFIFKNYYSLFFIILYLLKVILYFHPMSLCHSCLAFLNLQPISFSGKLYFLLRRKQSGWHFYWP